MRNLKGLEKVFVQCCNHLGDQGPDSLIEVNLELLNEFNLLNFHHKVSDTSLTRYFKVFERPEKVTLINEDYIVWIVPIKEENHAMTFTLIIKNQQDPPFPEITFVTTGVYNSSLIVLRVLEKFLQEIEENDLLIQNLR